MDALQLPSDFAYRPVVETGQREDALVVLARYPEPGRVKTRLARLIGEGAAATLYRAFLEDLARRLAADPRWRFFWAFAPLGAPFREEIAGAVDAFPQAEGDLGARMGGAMAEAFARGARRVVLVGSDIPHLSPGRVAAAFELLAAGARLVLGPAEDGGYYLVGAPDVPPIFDETAWGSRDVLERTLERAHGAGLDPVLLPATYDVDSEIDLRRLAADPVLGELAATRKALRALGVRGQT